jgi:glyoxylase-like metal-dependent hydrolase (beta-lactamase superfamily II)
MISFKLPLAPLINPASINIYLLTGEPLTLVDTGLKTEICWQALQSQLAEHGFSLGDIQQVVLTHAHPDHYGLAARIVDQTNAETLSHPDAVSRFRYWHLEWKRDKAFLMTTLLQAGAPAKSLEKRMQPKKEGGSPLFDPVAVTRTVYEGETITRGAEVWKVVDLPGHAPGMIGLCRAETSELITSDHLLPTINSRPGLYMDYEEGQNRPRYMADYVASLERVAHMGITTAWPAHGDPILQPEALALDWIGKHRQQAGRMAATLVEGDKTANQIWRALFPYVLPFDPVNGLVEVITYLDLLVVEGQVQTYEADGLLYYHLEQANVSSQ